MEQLHNRTYKPHYFEIVSSKFPIRKKVSIEKTTGQEVNILSIELKT